MTLLCSGPVVFLEEDHYVAEDFLPVLNLINDERMKKYPDCDIISMGTYLKSYSYSRDGKIVSQYLTYLWFCSEVIWFLGAASIAAVYRLL